MTDPKNQAAWLTASKVKPLEVKAAPYTHPKANEVVVRNRAVAINPVDWVLQESGSALAFPWLKYPFILGTDVAGEIVEVGSAVAHLKVGDRVVGQAVGQDEKRNTAAEGAFQLYVVLLADVTTPIPDDMSFENACVIPLGASTAACGLFQKDQLGLQHPDLEAKSTGKSLLVWGGSTSVGTNAIQLGVAAGYEVLTTCSPRNFDFVKKLGAAKAFDYNSKTVVQDIIQALKGKSIAGALSIGAGAADACMDILDKCNGNKFISMATYPLPSPPPERLVLLRTVYCYISWSVAFFIKSKLRGVGYKFIFGTTLIHNGVGKAVYTDFLPGALAKGSYVAAPDAVVVGKGLESIQAAMDTQKKGVSAKKLVVSL